MTWNEYASMFGGESPVPPSVDKLMGFEKKPEFDLMLRIDDVIDLTGYSTTKAQKLIKQLKYENKCSYSDATISASIFSKANKLDLSKVINFIEKKRSS